MLSEALGLITMIFILNWFFLCVFLRRWSGPFSGREGDDSPFHLSRLARQRFSLVFFRRAALITASVVSGAVGRVLGLGRLRVLVFVRLWGGCVFVRWAEVICPFVFWGGCGSAHFSSTALREGGPRYILPRRFSSRLFLGSSSEIPRLKPSLSPRDNRPPRHPPFSWL